MTTHNWLLISLLFGAAALSVFAALLRSATAIPVTTEGVIVAKAFKPASTYTQVPVGINRGMRGSTDIPIAESYVFEIRAERLNQTVFFALNTVASQAFVVGQRVRISYRKRGIPFSPKPYLVLDMQTVTPSPSPAMPK
jgi:hypothetical protein